MNKHGKGFTESIYQIQSRGLRYLTDIEDDMLICSNFTDHSVIALGAYGNEIWTFKHSELKGPYGLDKDPQNNIYVVGKKSNNIHILSREGYHLRIIKNITNPVGIHFKAFSFTCFVVCQSNSSSQLMLSIQIRCLVYTSYYLYVCAFCGLINELCTITNHGRKYMNQT